MSDVTSFRIKSEQYRRLARGISDSQLSTQLETLAREFDAQAAATEQRGEAPGNALSCNDLALASPRTCTSLTKDGVGCWPTFDASDSMPLHDKVASSSAPASGNAQRVERRRPGRPEHVSPELIPLLRGEAPTIPPVLTSGGEDDPLAAARGILVRTVASLVFWVGLVLGVRWVFF